MLKVLKGRVQLSLTEMVFGSVALLFLAGAPCYLYLQGQQQRGARAFRSAIIRQDEPAIAKMLREDPTLASHFNNTSLMWSRDEILKHILVAGGNACRAVEGVVPLHIVSHFGGLKEVRMIFERCPKNLNARDTNGLTPLDWAILSGKHANAAFLRAQGGVRGDEQRGA